MSKIIFLCRVLFLHDKGLLISKFQKLNPQFFTYTPIKDLQNINVFLTLKFEESK